MKSNIFRNFSILAVFVLLAALSVTTTAQQTGTRAQQEVQKQERQILELPIQDIDAETLRVRIPRECERIRPDVQMHDIADNFNPPGSAGTLSPALTNFLQSHNLTPKGYDDKRVNMVFADSFKIRSCKICYATLDFGVRHYQDIWQNDNMTMGGAPFSGTLRALSAPIWNPPLNSPINLTSPLNSYIFQNNVSFLDVVAQDDTDFDYMKLTVWYY